VTRLKWKHVLVRLVTVLASVRYRCTVFTERTIGSEIVLDAPDDTPRFVSNVPSARKSCLMHQMELLGEWVMWNFVSVCLETVLVLVQYR
jgi:hypothetical protein